MNEIGRPIKNPITELYKIKLNYVKVIGSIFSVNNTYIYLFENKPFFRKS